MATTRTVIDLIDISEATCQVRVQWVKQDLDDAGTVISEGAHSTLFDPASNVEVTIATNNANIAAMGYTPPVDAAWDVGRAQITATFTPDRVAAWQAAKAAAALPTA